MRLLPDKNAGLMGGEEIHAALRQHIGAVKSEAHRATVFRPISIALPRTASYGGVLQPEELEILQRVFDRICRDRKCPPESEEAEDLAATIIVLFQNGVLTEHELVAELDRGKDPGRLERASSDPWSQNG